MKGKSTLIYAIGVCFLYAPWATISTGAQNIEPQADFEAVPNDPGITMALFPIVKDDKGKQYVKLKSGIMLPIPGVGVKKGTEVLPVYRDPNEVYWFIDKNNNPFRVTQQQIMYKLGVANNTSLPPLAERFLAANGQTANGQMFNGQSTNAPPVVINNAPASNGSSSSGGASMAMSGLAAAGGAMAGAAIGSSMNSGNNVYYHGVPYYEPMYRARDANSYYYHGADGKQVYWNQNTHTADVTNQWGQQKVWHDGHEYTDDREMRGFRRGRFR